MREFGFLAIFLFLTSLAHSQANNKSSGGIISGNLLDSSSQKAVQGATVQLTLMGTNNRINRVSDKNGEFSFTDLS